MKNPLVFLLICISAFACNGINSFRKQAALPNFLRDTVPKNLSSVPFKNYLEVNAFEWDFVGPNSPDKIDESKFDVIKCFGGIRHYLDWVRIEPQKGKYTFSVTHAGGYDYDLIYTRMKEAGLNVLIDLKTCPKWLVNTYPKDQRDAENVPAPYGLDRGKAKSYILQAKAAFQLAARYGANKNIDSSLLLVDTTIRWHEDKQNTVKIGLNVIKYIECDNERDKWWKGAKAQQSPEEYAANMSAFYDGDKGKLGENVGVKTADSTMLVVMGGLGTADPKFVEKMIEWCRKYRGIKPDGKVDLCFDVINYHLYANDADAHGGKATEGVAPELSSLTAVARDFLKMAKEKANDMPVWVTESGYDVGKSTPQRAIPIGKKSSEVTQADWNLRTALLYARLGIKKSIFYMLDDVDLNSTSQYSSSGFVNADGSRRPSADYFLQTKKLIGDFSYSGTINNNPIVDVYKQGSKKIFVLVTPGQTGILTHYQLDMGNSKQATIYSLQIGKNQMLAKTVSISNGKLNIEVSETPIFVEVL
ncbi:hypothetical protein ABIB40_002053 [Pedobacter sp. UYP30]|uniref:beta-galactosidase n=1 Tax=Pedobacter sp. UYP30 TaxID=1756400 RepID=UPI0033957E27